MSRETILVVEDESDIQELIRYNLEKEGYTVQSALNGTRAIARVRQARPDLVVLDLMLPDMDGLTLCRQWRADPDTRDLPILMLTAKSEEADVVAGLEVGADDYVTKPFSPRVLLARIRSVLRRRKGPAEESETIVRGDIQIDLARRQVTLKGKPVELTFTEFEILRLLARRPGVVFSRYQIVDAVRGQDYPVTDRAVDVQIVGLRKKLGRFSEWVETVRGVGYRFME